MRDLIESINRGGALTPELSAQLRERVATFADAARGTDNVDLSEAGTTAGTRADVLADATRPEAERGAAYHPLIAAMSRAFMICRTVGVEMPGQAPGTGGMDGMGGM